MKKIILLILILLSTGCFEKSGQLTTTCIKKEDINTLYLETTYIIDFKSDIVNNVEVIYYYADRNIDTLSSIKTSINSNDRFINGLNRNVLVDTDKEFKISYLINMNDKEEILDKFYIEEKRSSMVKNLESKGFKCK